MDCINPFYVKSEQIYVPCGKCFHCRLQKTREWTLRCMHEMQYFNYSSFATLTYSPEHYPADGSIHKTELQTFIKKLRRWLEPTRIKYFACGEYSDSSRAHYHIILFGVNSNKKNEIHMETKLWRKGWVQLKPAEEHNIKYVAGYIRKKLNGKMADIEYGPREPPFQIQSQGIGRDWLNDNIDYVETNLNITVNGENKGLPRYYINKLSEKAQKRIKEEAEEKAKTVDVEKYRNYLSKKTGIKKHNIQFPLYKTNQFGKHKGIPYVYPELDYEMRQIRKRRFNRYIKNEKENLRNQGHKL